MPVETGVSGAVELVVSDADTALTLHSGSVSVLATPRVIALCEEATCLAMAGSLAEGETTVGMRIEISHLAPTNVGSKVRAEATLEKTEGRRLTFTVSVNDDCGLVAAGKITRVVVNEKTFLEKAR